MSAPNIVSVSTITGKTIGLSSVPITVTDILTNPASSGKVFKVNTIYAANSDGTNNVDATINFYDASAATTYRLAFKILVPATSTLDVLSKIIYLEEGDKITALASATSRLDLVISYEEIS